ncbi:MAG: AAA family ATPase, partial [Coriobacteriia bacterium]|nr:AAA family ATPase [Coriobacteriia bacterium]
GVGKSTTAINLGAALGEAKKKVLVVDIDPQGNTTSGFAVEKVAGRLYIYDGLINDIPVQEIIVETKCEGVSLIPSSIELAGAEPELANAIAREARLKDFIAPIINEFDYILIDCPPSLGLLTINALMAADSLLIPIQTEYYALEGLSKLLDTMKLVKVRLNQQLEVFGVVLTMYDKRTILARQVADEVREYFQDTVFQTVIPRSIKLAEAPSHGQTVLEYASRSQGAVAYRNLAKEVINRG